MNKIHDKTRMCKLLSLAILYSLFVSFKSENLTKTKKTNIVVILADDMRWDYISSLGLNKVIKTPNLNKLADMGVLFTDAFTTSAICTPSRTSILTGMYERKHGVTFGSQSALTEDAFANTYPMLLRKNGYYVGYVGKNHTPIGYTDRGFGYKSGVMESSFDYWQAGHSHLTFYPKKKHEIFKKANADNQVDIIQETIDGFINPRDFESSTNAFLKKRPTDKPFCLMVNFNVPHSKGTNSMQQRPSDPELYRSTYRDKRISLPDNYVAYDDIITNKLPKNVYNGEYLSSYDWVKTPKALRENQIRTCQTVTGIDNVVGNLIEQLESQGILENTVILFTSDHGLFHGEQGIGGKTLLYDIALRIPMILYAPGIREGSQVNEIVLNIDIAPTLLDFAGIDVPSNMQGKSLRTLLKENTGEWRKDFFSENLFMGQNYPRMEAVRTKEWKYIRYFSKEKDQHHILSLIATLIGEKPIYEELYNIVDDPHELYNQANREDKKELMNMFRKRITHLLKEAKGDDELPKTHIRDFVDKKFKKTVSVAYNKLQKTTSKSKPQN